MKYIEYITDEMLIKPVGELSAGESVLIERALEQTPVEMMQRLDALKADSDESQ